MKLPKLDMPMYSTELPVSGKKVKYRPYTVKEEKIILLAATTNDPVQLKEAAIQVLENCCSVDVTTLHPTDVEWLFIKLRIVSVSIDADIEVPIYKCTDEKCPESISVKVNIEENLVINGKEILDNEPGFTKKKDGWVIMFTDQIGIQMSVLTNKSTDEGEVMWDCFVAMFEGDNIITKNDVTKEEFIAYIDDLPRPFADKIEFLFNNQPWISMPIVAECPACGKKHEVNISGILDFLE